MRPKGLGRPCRLADGGGQTSAAGQWCVMFFHQAAPRKNLSQRNPPMNITIIKLVAASIAVAAFAVTPALASAQSQASA